MKISTLAALFLLSSPFAVTEARTVKSMTKGNHQPGRTPPASHPRRRKLKSKKDDAESTLSDANCTDEITALDYSDFLDCDEEVAKWDETEYVNIDCQVDEDDCIEDIDDLKVKLESIKGDEETIQLAFCNKKKDKIITDASTRLIELSEKVTKLTICCALDKKDREDGGCPLKPESKDVNVFEIGHQDSDETFDVTIYGMSFEGYDSETGGPEYGGLVHIDNRNTDGVVSVVESSFSKGTATYGGGLCVDGGESTVLIWDCVFTDNRAYYGGALFDEDDLYMVIKGSTFEGNEAYGSSVYAYDTVNVAICQSAFSQDSDPNNHDGCVIHSTGVQFTARDNTLTSKSGRALYLEDHEGVDISDNEFFDLNTDDDGGAMFLEPDGSRSNNYVLLRNNLFENCHADEYGGAIYISKGWGGAGPDVSLVIGNTFLDTVSGMGEGNALHTEAIFDSLVLRDNTFENDEKDVTSAYVFLDDQLTGDDTFENCGNSFVVGEDEIECTGIFKEDGGACIV